MAVIKISKQQRNRLDHLDNLNLRVYNAVLFLLFNIPNITPEEIDMVISHGIKNCLYRHVNRDRLAQIAIDSVKQKTSAKGIGDDITRMLGQEPKEPESDYVEPTKETFAEQEERKWKLLNWALSNQQPKRSVTISDTRMAG